MGWKETALGIGKGVLTTAINATEAALDVRNTTLNVNINRFINVTDEKELTPIQNWLLQTKTIQEHFGNVVFTLDNVETNSGKNELEHGDILIVDSHALMLRGIQTRFSIARTTETHPDFPIEHEVFRLATLSSEINGNNFGLHIDAAVRFVPKIGETSARIAVHATTQLVDDRVPIIRAALVPLPHPNFILARKMRNLHSVYHEQKGA